MNRMNHEVFSLNEDKTGYLAWRTDLEEDGSCYVNVEPIGGPDAARRSILRTELFRFSKSGMKIEPLDPYTPASKFLLDTTAPALRNKRKAIELYCPTSYPVENRVDHEAKVACREAVAAAAASMDKGTVVYMDTVGTPATWALLRAGVAFDRLCIVEQDEAVVKAMGTAPVIHATLRDHLEGIGARGLAGLWADYMGMLEGEPEFDLRSVVARGLVRPRGFVAVTVCTRGAKYTAVLERIVRGVFGDGSWVVEGKPIAYENMLFVLLRFK